MKTLGMGEIETILEMRNVTKRFPGVVACDHINFDLRAGEIHSILGENGAGKTTLMNILYGLYQMDEGEILVDGKKVSICSPRDAISLGIGMIHQLSLLVPRLSMMENVILGREPTRGPFINRKRAEEDILELEKKFNLKVSLNVKVEQLSAGEKQQVEIIRALYRGARILIMDEPTSVLAPLEKEELVKSLRELAREGISSVPFITHKLPEVIAVSDRVTILREGKVVDVLETRDVNIGQLARKMVGRDVLFDVRKLTTKKGRKILEARDLQALDDIGTLALKGASLSVREGEILGVAGVSGNGQKELVEVIAGQRREIAGKVLLKGIDTTNYSSRKVRDLGIGYIPEDRREKGILPDCSVSENLVLGVHSRPPFAYRWFTYPDQFNKYARKLVAEYDIDTTSIEKPAGKLSGGNMQRLILARELSRDPDIILADKPTSGLDVGSQEFIRQRLMKERDRGKAILLISEDLDEIMMMSDRIAVMYEGSIVKVVPVEEATKEEIGEMMAGGG